MDNQSEDIACPANNELVSDSQRQVPSENHVKESYKKNYRRCCSIIYYPCSLLCISILIILASGTFLMIVQFMVLFIKKNNEIQAAQLAINATIENTTIITNMSIIPVADVELNTRTTASSTTSTTTMPISCGTSCFNQSWISSVDGIAFCPFEGSYADIINGYDRILSTNLPTFGPGYIGQAAFFNASEEQAMYTSFIPLNNISFTVEAWIKPTAYPNWRDHSIVGLCPYTIPYQCLNINIRYRKLYFGFYEDDLEGTTDILLNKWVHVAFTFDAKTNLQTIYLNGFQDANRIASHALQVTSGNFTVATNELVDFGYGYFQVKSK